MRLHVIDHTPDQMSFQSADSKGPCEIRLKSVEFLDSKVAARGRKQKARLL
jgi:hypothetical protein